MRNWARLGNHGNILRKLEAMAPPVAITVATDTVSSTDKTSAEKSIHKSRFLVQRRGDVLNIINQKQMTKRKLRSTFQ